jgi:hypothetical protein
VAKRKARDAVAAQCGSDERVALDEFILSSWSRPKWLMRANSTEEDQARSAGDWVQAPTRGRAVKVGGGAGVYTMADA